MDGDVNTAIKEGNVELTSKETLAANVSERLIENFVTSRLFVKDGKGLSDLTFAVRAPCFCGTNEFQCSNTPL